MEAKLPNYNCTTTTYLSTCESTSKGTMGSGVFDFTLSSHYQYKPSRGEAIIGLKLYQFGEKKVKNYSSSTTTTSKAWTMLSAETGYKLIGDFISFGGRLFLNHYSISNTTTSNKGYFQIELDFLVLPNTIMQLSSLNGVNNPANNNTKEEEHTLSFIFNF